MFYVGVLIGLIATVVCAVVMMLVGGSIIGTLETVQQGMNQSAEANATFTSMTSTTWSSMRMLPIVVTVLIAGIIITAIGAFGAIRSGPPG